MPVFRNPNPDVRTIFSYNDVPSYLLEAGDVDVTVYTRTVIRPDGSIQGCTAEESSGDAKLDAYTCKLIVRRAKFVPGTWSDGSPAFGVVRVPVRWRVVTNGTNKAPPAAADLDLSVSQLPKGAGKTLNMSLAIGADSTGRPVTCADYQLGPTTPPRRFPELVELACQQVLAKFLAVAPLDSSGKPVRSVQSVSVRFVSDH